jgi:oligopeptidase B
MKKNTLIPPQALEIAHTHKEHGILREDPYFWMKNRDSKDVLEYLKKENTYTQSVMKKHSELQKALFEELKNRIVPAQSSVPVFYKNEYFYNRTIEKKDYPLICRKKGSLEAKEEILIDENILAKNHDFFHLGHWEISPNHRWLIYNIDTEGRRFYNIYIRDLESKKQSDTQIISKITGEMDWDNESKGFYYTQQDPVTLRSYQVYYYDLEKKSSQLIYEEKDSTVEIGISKSKTEKFLFMSRGRSAVQIEDRYLDLSKPQKTFQVFLPEEKGLEYSIHDTGKSFFILTNWKAENFQLFEAPYNAKTKKQWKIIIAGKKDVYLEHIDTYKDFYVVQEKKAGLNSIRIKNYNSKQKDKLLKFPDPSYTVNISPLPEFNSSKIRYIYESLNRPESTFEVDAQNLNTTLLKEQQVLGGFDKNNYVSERVWAKAYDGVKIPISIVYRKDRINKEDKPLLVYGYGSYGYSTDAEFRMNIISLLDRGFAFAIAHIRGGSDLGRQWYENGKMLKKTNTFKDFISATEFLVKNKYADPKKVFAMGGSAGGLLMGTVANMRPDLYKGMVAQVPFVDVLTTMLDESLPLTTGEYTEWGNPNVKKYFDYMKTYSPYDNVKKQNYPNMLVLTGYHDSQVQYWEPAKWVAKLRKYKSDQNLLLFDVEFSAGHGGKSGRYEALKKVALVYSFLISTAEEKN